MLGMLKRHEVEILLKAGHAPCCHFSFAIGSLNPAGHGHDTVVRKHIPKKVG
jgi:hypothetical protein